MFYVQVNFSCLRPVGLLMLLLLCILFVFIFRLHSIFVFLLIFFLFRFIVRFSWTSMCVILFFPFNCLLHWLICSVFLLYILYFIGNKIAAHQCDQLASISVSYVRDLLFWSQYAMVHDSFFYLMTWFYDLRFTQYEIQMLCMCVYFLIRFLRKCVRLFCVMSASLSFICVNSNASHLYAIFQRGLQYILT